MSATELKLFLDLLNLSTELKDRILAKFKLGIKKYGEENWKSANIIEELDGEYMDIICYTFLLYMQDKITLKIAMDIVLKTVSLISYITSQVSFCDITEKNYCEHCSD